MIAPRVLRELSWAAGKLREVARVLSALEVRLTIGVDSDNMSGLEAWRAGSKSTRPGSVQAGPEAPSLPFLEEYCNEDLAAERRARAEA